MTVETSKPWTQSWLYAAKGDRITQLWLFVLHSSAILGLFVIQAPSKMVIAIWIVSVALSMLGVSVSFHRCLAHKALTINPVVEQILIFFAVFGGAGKPTTWVANHMRHHRYSDKDGDISSPQHGGFWWSHLRWLWQAGQVDPNIYCPRIANQRRYQIWDTLQMPVLTFSLFGGLYFGLDQWVWLGPIRLLYILHAQASVNSFFHYGDKLPGARDHSRNMASFAPIQFFVGENWHGNHHKYPSSAKFGIKPMQIDLGWEFIRLLSATGLAGNLKIKTLQPEGVTSELTGNINPAPAGKGP